MSSWTKRAATTVSGMALVAGSLLAGAPSAQAAGACASDALCIYDGSSFTGKKISSRSTNSCFSTSSYDFDWIASYKNNLPVKAIVWVPHDKYPWFREARTFPAGGFSSRIGVDGLGGEYYDQVCMGNAKPWG
ncbi:peptidase inhibitor family I36 protein [Streptomyces sp. SM1P]|uniref:peptidase inhibitor family I36 protein n=1 Tax=Streptomyces TaxID=1883 RepID=UPI000BF1A830|nr:MULTISPECIES: peptidase inhibitor family I36 protein [unclassified Streptomyces]RUP68447.1 Peptidase inhibitor family I36 [Streptomyces sp. NP10]